MNKYFMFVSKGEIQSAILNDIIATNFHDEYELKFISPRQGYIFADCSFLKVIENLLPLISADLGVSMCVLVSYAYNDISKKAISLCVEKTGVRHLSDLLLDLLIENDKSLNETIYKEFFKVNRDILLTAKAYLQSGQNASSASVQLYLHRNTFNYRLNKFIAQTGLDIRDYHNGIFFLLAMRISNL